MTGEDDPPKCTSIFICGVEGPLPEVSPFVVIIVEVVHVFVVGGAPGVDLRHSADEGLPVNRPVQLRGAYQGLVIRKGWKYNLNAGKLFLKISFENINKIRKYYN